MFNPEGGLRLEVALPVVLLYVAGSYNRNPSSTCTPYEIQVVASAPPYVIWGNTRMLPSTATKCPPRGQFQSHGGLQVDVVHGQRVRAGRRSPARAGHDVDWKGRIGVVDRGTADAEARTHDEARASERGTGQAVAELDSVEQRAVADVHVLATEEVEDTGADVEA